MKLDSKEKYQRIRKFVGELKLKPDIQPFYNIEDIAKCGIYDFCYINKNPSTFQKIQKKLKESKYDDLSEFIEDLKQIFITVSDYIYLEDPLQAVVQSFKNQIDKFSQKFEQDFKVTFTLARPRPQIELPKKKEQPKIVRPPAQIQQAVAPRERGANITQKLQMLFLLKENQNNQAYIRSLGSAYGIGTEMQEEYIITLDNKNSYWMQFLTRQH